MLVIASAEAGVDHQLLFTTAAPHLVRNVKYMSGRDAVDVSLGHRQSFLLHLHEKAQWP